MADVLPKPPPYDPSDPFGLGDYKQSPGQTPSGGGDYPKVPGPGGGPWTGWGAEFGDLYARLLPAASFSKSTTQAQNTIPQDVVWNIQNYNDIGVVADSSGATFAIPSALAGNELNITGYLEWTANSSGQRRVFIHEMLADASTRTRNLLSGNASTAIGAVAFSYPLYVGQGSTQVSNFTIQASISTNAGSTTNLTNGSFNVVRVR